MTSPADERPGGPLPPMHCLIAFEAVARNRQLARAAHELSLTKSALCSSIALLEHRLKVQLVRRYSPTVELSEAGRQYLAATQAFSHALRDALCEHAPRARTQLRVSASRAMGRLWLGPRLADFVQQHPQVELLVTTTDRIDSVLGDGVDVALRYGGSPATGTVSVPLVTDRFIAVAAPALMQACGGTIADERLASVPRIQHPSLHWDDWLRSMGQSAAGVSPRLATGDLQVALLAAVAGVGVAIVPSLFARPFLERGELRRVGGHVQPAKPYHAVVAQAQLQRPPMRAFLAWLHAQLPAPLPGPLPVPG